MARVSSRDPLRRILLGIFLLLALTFVGMMGTLLYGLVAGGRLAEESNGAATALLAVERLRRGDEGVTLPELGGRAELELALVQGDPVGLQRALARYESSALEVLLRVQRERDAQMQVQAVAGGALVLLALGALGGLLAAARKRVLEPVEILDRLARRVLEGDLRHRAPALDGPEFDRLGHSMNEMLESLDRRVAELEASRANLAAVVAAAPVALVEVAPDGRILSANPAAEDLAGGSLPGRLASEALPLEDETGGGLAGDPELRHWTLDPTGRAIPVALSRVPVQDHGGALLQIRDLRPEEDRERLRRETLSIVYRELRAPLARILEVGEATGDEDLASLARHVLELAENLTLADALRRGRWTFRREPLDLSEVVRGAVRALGVPAREREVLLQGATPEAVPVGADAAGLRLVVHHLLGRALEGCHPGGKLSVSCRRSGGRALLEIVPDEDEQADALRDWLLRPASAARDPEGRALVHQLLLAHEGVVESGSGERLVVAFPEGVGEPAAAREVEVEARSPAAPAVAAAGLSQDPRFADWLRHALGLPVEARPEDLPEEGLAALLLDLDGPPPDLARMPKVPLLILAAHPEEALERFLEMRAQGLVGRDESAASLRRALERVARGETVLSPAAASALLHRAARSRARRVPAEFEGLTGREQEIFVEIARGRSNKEIAETLFISEGTVKTHVNNLLRKLELRDRVQLLLYAARHDLLPPEMELP